MTNEEVQIIRRVRARLNVDLVAAERGLEVHRARIQRRRDKKQPVRNAPLEPTKSQRRLLTLLGLTLPERYAWAAEMLVTAGYSGSGNPWNHDWRTVQFMSDSEFIEAAKIETYRTEMREAHHLANEKWKAEQAKRQAATP